ncbi:hypothetical protein TNIN_229331 [Trichonephila inaurata madagascariensis]|uniref:Uncharacterized protein n=1 Tax=Trichonephila inaurata madagascariensis TaxID=2747483 RepID=A0A8X7CG81_9ARAC|nr:hypothetical protein TNIN_229331 [Trichonephila inaurata madagascariensis]
MITHIQLSQNSNALSSIIQNRRCTFLSSPSFTHQLKIITKSSPSSPNHSKQTIPVPVKQTIPAVPSHSDSLLESDNVKIAACIQRHVMKQKQTVYLRVGG